MTTPAVKYIRVPNRLAALLNAPGGISRAQAVAAATKGIESLRDWSTEFIWKKIAEIEQLVVEAAKADARKFSTAQMQAILEEMDCILNLTGTYGYQNLDSICKSLCDLVLVMDRKGLGVIEPIAVHVRAMRLLGPGTQLPEGEAATILNDLGKLTKHFQSA